MKLLDLQFKGEVSINDQDKLFAQMVSLVLKSSPETIQNLIIFLNQLVDESL
jgi:hypothetical protein